MPIHVLPRRIERHPAVTGVAPVASVGTAVATGISRVPDATPIPCPPEAPPASGTETLPALRDPRRVSPPTDVPAHPESALPAESSQPRRPVPGPRPVSTSPPDACTEAVAR